jgi:hypothetical protein
MTDSPGTVTVGPFAKILATMFRKMNVALWQICHAYKHRCALLTPNMLKEFTFNDGRLEETA